MLHIISGHRYPLALSILLTCVLPSQYAGQQLRVCIVCVCVCGRDTNARVYQGQARTVHELLLPSCCCFRCRSSCCCCFCFSSCSSLSFCVCFAVLLLLPPSCTQLEAINFTCAQTMRQTARQREREREKEKRDREREREQQSQRVLAKN